MYFIIAYLLFILSIIAHEAGHAVAMRKYGVALKHAGLGLPLGRYYIPIRSRYFARFGEGFEFRIYPLLLGAYVESGAAPITALSYEERAHIYGAGVIGNIYFSALAFVILALLNDATKPEKVFNITIPVLETALISIATVFVFYFFARKISAYVFPVLSFIALGYIGWKMYGFDTARSAELVGGMLTAWQITTLIQPTLSQAFAFAGILSLSIVFVNLLPFYPIDGGQTVEMILRQKATSWWADYFMRLGNLVFLFLVVVSIGGDIYHLLHPISALPV